MQILDGSEKPASPPKFHLFMHKLRKINVMDRQIRQKWLKLQRKKLQQQQQSMHQILQIQRLRQNQQYQRVTQNVRLINYPSKIIKIKADIVRQQAFLRKKLYDQVYYRKNKRDHSPILYSLPTRNESPVKNISLKKQNSKKIMKTQGNQQNSPILLRQRSKTVKRQMQIIHNRYKDEMKVIETKKIRNQIRNWDSQKKMINRLEGKKFYYQLASSWQPPNSQDNN